MNGTTVRRIRDELRHSGFDLCHPIHTSWYNRQIEDEGLVRSGALRTLPEPSACLEYERGGEGGAMMRCNALLIGNSKTVWPAFLDWLASKVEQKRKERKDDVSDEEALASLDGPFDAFVEESIPRALRRCLEGRDELKSCELFWSNGRRRRVDLDRRLGGSTHSDDTAGAEKRNYHCYDGTADSFLVSMQRVATTTGEYWNDDGATRLCVHPVYGTWTAFRAVAVFETTRVPRIDLDVPPPAPPPCPCPVSDEEKQMAKAIFDRALQTSSSDGDGYVATLDKSWEELCEYLHGAACSGSKWEEVPDSMRPWIRLRESIAVGRDEWKYADPQLLYHYTKDRDILRAELGRIHESFAS